MHCQQNSPSTFCSNEKLVSCDYPGCKQTFRSRFSYKRHQLVHTKERKYVCKKCGKKFTFAQHLREHGYRHDNLKPYVCSINNCQETFRHSSELSLHRRTHAEYRLKKYRYAKKTQMNEEITEKLEGKIDKLLKAETADSNIDSLDTKGHIRISEVNNHDILHDDLDLDIVFLTYVQNITSQNDGEWRPKLPRLRIN